MPRHEPGTAPGTTVLHIGLPKTGSTALQYAASSARAALAAAGTTYPGTRLHHRIPFLRLLDAPPDVATPSDVAAPFDVAAPPAWRRLLQQVEDARRERPNGRVLLSAESASQATPPQITRIVDDLGAPLHVVLTLRSIAERVPSVWQQRVRNGHETRPLDAWSTALLDHDASISDETRLQALGVAHLAARWADAVGPAAVTAVIVDRASPRMLYDAFESLLGLPAGTLADMPPGPEARLNRGMSPVEIEFARRLRIAAAEAGVSAADASRLLHRGGFLRVQSVRTPPATEGRILLSSPIADRLVQAAHEQVDALTATGVRIIGDPRLLAAPPPVRDGDAPGLDAVPVDLAVETLLGVIARATGRDHLFGTDRAEDDGAEPPP